MGTSNYSDEFKRDAVHQITVRGWTLPVKRGKVRPASAVRIGTGVGWLRLECHSGFLAPRSSTVLPPR